MIGIDFGTTNSTVGRAASNGEVELVSFPALSGFTVSFRSLLYLQQVKHGARSQTHAWTGPSAIEHYLAAEHKGRLIQSLKSYLSDRSLTGTAVFGRHYTLEDLISRILTGQFPNYEAVLPRENNKTVVLERAELADAVRRVSQLADQRSHAVKLAVSTEGVEISASSPEYGEAKESIEKEYKGDPIAIGFNSTYMLDFLGAAADGPISIELKDEQSAGQMRPLADESYRYRYVIMPMRI